MVNTQSIIQSYTEVKENEIKQDKLKDTQSPQLISALDKDTQLMKIAVIRLPNADAMLNEILLNSNSIWANFGWLIKMTCLNKPVT